MNRPDIDAIEERCNEATEGPWGMTGTDGVRTPHGDLFWAVERWDYAETRPVDAEIEGTYQDAHFVATARTDVPLLIAYIRHLEAQRAELIDGLLEWAEYGVSESPADGESVGAFYDLDERIHRGEFG